MLDIQRESIQLLRRISEQLDNIKNAIADDE
jgi:hypothetical protein